MLLFASAVIGMEVSEVMFISSLDHRGLFQRTILLINTLMQMRIRFQYLLVDDHNFWKSNPILYLIFSYFVQWVSHRNHRGNICGVDFIWLLNPNRYRKLLKTSWSEAVFGMFKVRNTLCFPGPFHSIVLLCFLNSCAKHLV